MGVCGDSDKIVPYEKHMKIVAERYRALGGNVEIILKPVAIIIPIAWIMLNRC